MKHSIYILLLLSLALFFNLNVHAQSKQYEIRFISVDNSSNEILKPYSDFRGDSITVLNELKNLKNELHVQGYLSASIDSVKFDADKAIVHLFQGRKYIVGKIDYSGLENTALEALGLHGRQKKHINIYQLADQKNKLVRHYENSGFPFAKAYFEPVDIKDSLFNASLQVAKGDYYAMDSMYIKGDVKISSNYIQKTIQIQPGDAFNQEHIADIGNRIQNLNFISEIKPAEIEFRQDVVDLYLYLQKQKANVFNGIIGFLQSEQDGKLQITGDLMLNLVNSFGRGEEIFLNWEKLESSSQKLNVAFDYPYLFKSDFGVDFNFELYKKDSTYLSLNSGLGLRLFLSKDDFVRAYYRYKSSSRIGSDKEQLVSANFADVQSNVIGVSYHLNRLDYRFNPRKGVVLNLFGGAGFKNISGLKSDTLNLNIDQNTTELEAGLDLGIYYPIYGNFVFHFSNSTRYLDQFSDKEKQSLQFENELYRFGGAKSLRGFDESIFLASIYSLQNAEIRYLFDKNSAFYAFWNGAYYYQNLSTGVTEDFPWGFGIGMDFDTKAGIFSLSYALGKQFDNPFQLQTAKIHFGYISRF